MCGTCFSDNNSFVDKLRCQMSSQQQLPYVPCLSR